MRTLIIIVAAALSIACDRESPETTDEPTQATEPETEQQKEAEEDEGLAHETQDEPSEEWTTVDAEALDETQKAQMEKALAAQKALGKTLVGALATSIQADGFAKSIKFCRGEAPDITKKIASEHGVRIGRTSHKLRNPDNAPPTWAEPLVDEKVGARTLRTGPDGRLGVLSPIPTAELCVNCHGPKDKLAEGVPDALAASYPNDQATGFEEGQLRGWFWVEVPGS